MNSLTTEYLNRLKFSFRHASTLKKIGEYQGKQMLFARQTPEALDSLKHIAIIESSESSNRLEGITAPHNRVKKIVERTESPETRSEQEIAGYRDALAGIHESAIYMEFSPEIVRELHRTIYQYMSEDGGNWKTADNEIIELNPDGSFKRVRFATTPAAETPQAMEALVQYYKEAVNVHYIEPLVIIPLAVLDFLCIHPFRDGNGRVARLFTLMLLYHFDFQVGKYISLERIFEETKQGYYDSLEKSSQGWHERAHDAFPWLTYFWGTLLKAYGELEDKVKDIRKGKGCKTDQIIAAVNKKRGPFAISDIENDCPLVSRDMIRIVLRQLRDEGVIHVQGKGRGAKWVKSGSS
jgi:Fic family protein